MANSAGVPIAVDFTPGQAHDFTRCEAVLDLVRPPVRTGGTDACMATWRPTGLLLPADLPRAPAPALCRPRAAASFMASYCVPSLMWPSVSVMASSVAPRATSRWDFEFNPLRDTDGACYCGSRGPH